MFPWLLAAVPAAVPFTAIVVDADMAGDCKMAGDLDGDGLPDLVVGGSAGSEDLRIYRATDGLERRIAEAAVEFTTDGALGDVDGDGDLDVVIPDGPSGTNLLWFENPRPDAPAFGLAAWTRHEIGAAGSWAKDVEVADFDGDGRSDVATRSASTARIFFRTVAGGWLDVPLDVSSLGVEGMASGFVDAGDAPDLIVQGAWLRNPGGAAARVAALWSEHAIGDAPSEFKALVADVDSNGIPDVLFSSSEGTADVVWWTPTTGDPTGAWTGHTVASDVERCHTLQAGDVDLDGETDVVLAQMHTSSAKQVMWMRNADGAGTSWTPNLIDGTGLHNGVLVDLGDDGDLDLFGANWTGNAPVRAWINGLDPPPAELVFQSDFERGDLGDWTSSSPR